MSTKLYALLLEDVKKDAELLQEILSNEGFDLTMDVVDAEKEYVSNLKRHNYDIIFADFTLPSFNGQVALELAKNICPNIPFICISGTIGEDKAVELLKQGATDYVLKDRMERFAFATKRALDAAIQLAKFREAEEAIKLSEIKFRSLATISPVGIFLTRPDGYTLFVNPQWSIISGLLQNEALGYNWLKAVHPDDKEKIMNGWTEAARKKETSTAEYRFLHPDGRINWVLGQAVPEINNDNIIIGYVGTITDITAIKNYENELKIAKEKAEESDGLKTAFLQNISHEIRTPLTAICGFAGMLNRPNITDEKRESFVTIIKNSSDQLLSIVTDVLTISSLDTKQEKITIHKVEVNTIIVELLSIFKLQADKQNILIYSNKVLTDEQSYIYTDEIKVVQIMTNLISNALKFTHKGSIEFGYNLKTDSEPVELQFFVKDTGIGIKADLHEKIFERFRQADKSIQLNYGGTGLGLSISKGFVELLGGKIWVESETEKGSTFYFTIPYKPVNEINKTIAITKQKKNFKTILVAEDEEYNFLFIQELLSDLNLNLIHAKNGAEAVDICKSNTKIDLILMDIKMPIMEGHEAAKLIKEFRPELPIIAQSAYALINERAKYEGIFDDYITKPIDEEELKQKVMKYSAIQKNE